MEVVTPTRSDLSKDQLLILRYFDAIDDDYKPCALQFVEGCAIGLSKEKIRQRKLAEAAKVDVPRLRLVKGGAA